MKAGNKLIKISVKLSQVMPAYAVSNLFGAGKQLNLQTSTLIAWAIGLSRLNDFVS